jgi:hypothetical protein
MVFMSRAVERERQRLGGELTPKVIPLLSALEAKNLLIKGTGRRMFLVLYITKSSARTGIAARRDEIFFLLMAVPTQSRLAIPPATPAGAATDL